MPILLKYQQGGQVGGVLTIDQIMQESPETRFDLFERNGFGVDEINYLEDLYARAQNPGISDMERDSAYQRADHFFEQTRRPMVDSTSRMQSPGGSLPDSLNSPPAVADSTNQPQARMSQAPPIQPVAPAGPRQPAMGTVPSGRVPDINVNTQPIEPTYTPIQPLPRTPAPTEFAGPNSIRMSGRSEMDMERSRMGNQPTFQPPATPTTNQYGFAPGRIYNSNESGADMGPVGPYDTQDQFSTFEKAFANARHRGMQQFPFNGKWYHTKTKEEMLGERNAANPIMGTMANRGLTAEPVSGEMREFKGILPYGEGANKPKTKQISEAKKQRQLKRADRKSERADRKSDRQEKRADRKEARQEKKAEKKPVTKVDAKPQPEAKKKETKKPEEKPKSYKGI